MPTDGIAGIRTLGGGGDIIIGTTTPIGTTRIRGGTTDRRRPAAAVAGPMGSLRQHLLAGAGTGDLAEHRARHQPGAARIIEIKQPANEFPGSVEAGDRPLRGV